MRRHISISVVLALITGGLFSGTVAQAQVEEPPATRITVKAGYGEADATWHVGAGAGQYASKSPDNVVNSVSGGDVDPHGHSIAQSDSRGVHSRLSYRAIVVQDEAGDQTAFVKSDSYLAQDYLLRRVGQILLLEGSSISYEEILHMASHNHSSPYYMTPSAGVWIFQDAFDIRAFEYHARAMAQAIMDAESSMVDARMGATTVEHDLFKGMIQRKGDADDGTPRGYPDDFGDMGVSVVRFDSLKDPNDPQPLATLINWGQHPEGLDGHALITGDFVASLERFVERETGAPLVFGQGDVGSAEAGPGRPEKVAALGIPARWSHTGFAQGERGAYLLARDVITGWDQIETGSPLVPFSSDFDVAAGNAWVAGPYSHPYPSVANCRTETTVEGDPGVTGPPECMRGGFIPTIDEQLWEQLKEAGIQPPDNYDLPSYAGLEENTRLHLQAFKLGEVVIASCACEAQVDLILNFESRANETQGDFWDGFDWTTRMDCTPAGGPEGDWTCTKKADDPRPRAVHGGFTVSNYRYQRMLAQIHNPADGWDAPENINKAISEPSNLAEIFGNFTREELSADAGYKLPIAVGHASDYNGYTVSYREYQSWDDYRKSLTSYGPHTADYMVTRMVRLAGTLNGVPNAELETDIQRGLPDEARQLAMSTALGGTAFATYEAWRAALPNDLGPAEATAEPQDIKRFDAATFSWRGGSNAVDNPVVRVERLVDGEWITFADQSGEVQTKLDFPDGANAFADTYSGGQEWIWTANFEASNVFPAGIGSTPAGEYRFVVDGHIRSSETPAPYVGADTPYHLESDPFTVSRWDGLGVRDLTVGPDGTVSFDIDPIAYPTTYDSAFPYVDQGIQDDQNGRLFCSRCSFRPWASGGHLAEAVVTVESSEGTLEKVEATCIPEGPELPNETTAYSCSASAALSEGDRVLVLPGDVIDNYGETTATCLGPEGEVECPMVVEPTPTPTDGPSTTPTPTDDPTIDPTPTDDPTTTPTPTDLPTGSATPTPTSTPSNGGGGGGGGGQTTPPPTVTPAGDDRGIAVSSIASSAMKVNYQKKFTLTGQVTGDRTCNIGEVELLKRTFGTDEFATVDTVPVNLDGMWTTERSSRRNASYAVRPVNNQLCDGQMSTSIDVLVRARVIAAARNTCDFNHRLRGSVSPAYPGTVVKLQDRRRGKWVTTGRKRLNEQSRFRFQHCSGSRVMWSSQDVANIRGIGRVLVLRRID